MTIISGHQAAAIPNHSHHCNEPLGRLVTHSGHSSLSEIKTGHSGKHHLANLSCYIPTPGESFCCWLCSRGWGECLGFFSDVFLDS